MPHCGDNTGAASLWNSLGAILGFCVEKDSFRVPIAHRNAWPPSWAQSNLQINTSRMLMLGRYFWWDHLKRFILPICNVINNLPIKYLIRASILIITCGRLSSNWIETFPCSVHASCSPLYLNLLLAMQRPHVLQLTVILAPVRSLPSTPALIRSHYCYGISANKPFPLLVIWLTASHTTDEQMNRFVCSVGCQSGLSLTQNKLIPWASNVIKPPFLAISVLCYQICLPNQTKLFHLPHKYIQCLPKEYNGIDPWAGTAHPVGQRDQT